MYAYIVRVRLEIGARLLALTDLPVADISVKTGYESQASFGKAFKNKFNISPLEYRENKMNENITFNHNFITEANMSFDLKPKIRTIKPKKVIYIQTIEPYGGTKMQNSWPKLFEFIKKHKLFSFGMETIGVSYDDPNITEPERCRYDSCITITRDVKPEGEIGVKTIEGGKYAVFLYKGAYDGLGDAYNRIARNWLPSSGYRFRDVPCFDVYLSNPEKTAPEKLKTEIYIPVE